MVIVGVRPDLMSRTLRGMNKDDTVDGMDGMGRRYRPTKNQSRKPEDVEIIIFFALKAEHQPSPLAQW
jgi:hypothetical protein